MASGIEDIGKKDILWSYFATLFMVGAGVILLPFILNKMSAETVGMWNIFQTISTLVLLLDFGFRPSFARTISYILSGAQHLQTEGVEVVSGEQGEIHYSLLKTTLEAMRQFYRKIALAVCLALVTIGTVYFYFILQKYHGNQADAITAWVVLVIINCYNLYTLYYDALLLGKGYVKRSQQITILGQSLYLLLAILLIYLGLGLTAIVAAQLVSTIVRRVLMHRVFFTAAMQRELDRAQEEDTQPVLHAIYPNAIKMGLTQLGGFCVNRSSVLLGSAFLSLEQVASYGITMQVMDILARCGTVTYQSYVPKLAAYRAEHNLLGLRQCYRYSVLGLLVVYVLGGIAWYYLGDWALGIIHSQTLFVPATMLIGMLVISLLEQNHSIAAGFIMAGNKVPFFIPSLVSGAATVGLLYLFLGYFHWEIWALILAPGLAQLAYQNWKWPSVLLRELHQKS